MGDCNDSNAMINSLASEVCNSSDDNCNGQVNEGLIYADYYEDLDGDGYGFGNALNACDQPVGYVSSNSDCDDSNVSINPNAQELCNTLDDNCNNSVDEGVLISFFVDSDLDGFGSGSAVLLCAQTTGFVLVNGDCNDSNSLVNPSSTESCLNTIDDDCDGLINEGCANQLIGDNFSNPQSIAISYFAWIFCLSECAIYLPDRRR
jgi:hypothetical protein